MAIEVGRSNRAAVPCPSTVPRFPGFRLTWTQLGYKSLKFVERIVVKDEFDDLGKIGDLQNGWAWYVGI